MDLANSQTRAFLQKKMNMFKENPEILQDAFQHIGKYMNTNHHGDKSALIQQHLKSYRHYEQIMKRSNENSLILTKLEIPSELIVKKDLNSNRCESQEVALPIPIRKLAVGTVHHGRVLKGTLIVNPFIINGAHSLLQDRAGDVVKISFYPPEIEQSLDFQMKWRLGHKYFPKNLQIKIFEPFFKQAMDNTFLVRVDNMADISTGPFTQPSLITLNEEGKKHVAKNQFDEACESYTEGIQSVISSQPLYAALFQNLALVNLNLNENTTALQYAIGAILLNPHSSPKAYFRAALALEKLGCHELAKDYCRLTLEQNKRAYKDPLFKQLCSRLKFKDLGEDKTKQSIWTNMQMIKLLANDPVLSDETSIHKVEEEEPCALKKEGNDYMMSKEYCKAKVFYEKAIFQLEKLQKIPMTTLISNISLCYFKMGEYAESMLYATVAMFLLTTNKKAHFRRISSLLNLELIQDASRCFDYGMLLLKEENKCLMSLKNRLVVKGKESIIDKKKSQELEYKPDHAPYQHVEMMNTLMEISGKGGDFLRDIPSFHIRYPQVKSWPEGCKVADCRELLNEAFALGKSDMHRFVLENLPKEIVTEDHLIKRLGTNCKSRFDWLFSSNFGDVTFKERNNNYGFGRVHHSYGNVAQCPQIMTKGTVHVSIGFADLQEMMLCKLFEKKHVSSTDPNKGQVLKWIGYDQSPYVIAKTLVIIEMMKDATITAQSIVQVWYSAAWSHHTVQLFRKALNSVCLKQSLNKMCNDNLVTKYLIHWQQHDVSLKESRQRWKKNHGCSWSDEILNWKQENDQLAICSYAMTGQLYSSDISVGSIVMFALPQGEQVAKNEDVFKVVNLKELLIFYEKLGDSCYDCVDALTSFLELKVSLLISKIQRNEVELDVFREKICLENKKLIEDICYKHCPSSMSWSNLCDYIDPYEFHKIARKCSINNGTVHFAYSMNWPQEVKGSSVVEYCLGDNIETMKNLIKTTLSKAEKKIQSEWYLCVPSAQKYMTFPTCTNPLNLLDWSLINKNDLYKNWFNEFIKAEGGNMEEHQYQLVDFSSLYHFNYLTNSILSFCFTYDSEVKIISNEVQ